MSVADDYFARVRPLLGAGLSGCAVEVDDAEVALVVLELLGGCMLDRIVVTRAQTRRPLERHRAWKQPFAPVRTDPAAHVDARVVARRGAPAIEWRAAEREVLMTADPGDLLAWLDISYHVARTLRDVLLGRAPWPDGVPPAYAYAPRGVAIDLRGRHVMVIGCGSLGSEAARILAGSGARWTLVDDARVTVFNLARQWYGAAEVGRAKVDCLAARLGRSTTWASRVDVAELGALEARVRADRPDVVLLATGTHHHGMIGQLLWRLGIPHVAACCYPQARFFEVNIVSPPARTPCLHCFRGQLYAGAPAPLPIDDEIASFLYQPVDDGERARRYADLVAEPATSIETQRAAAVLAHAAVELCAASPSAWLSRVLAEQTTCLLGGNAAIPTADGGFAYGIRAPGQVIRLGVEDLAGASDRVRCDACGRELAIAFRDELPAAGDDADAALL